MNQERIFQVLLGARLSEKAARLGEHHNQFVFKVAKTATKPEIKRAIESLFSVKVKSVTTLNVKGKVKRFGRLLGQRSGWKKAYVSLQEGHGIDLSAAE